LLARHATFSILLRSAALLCLPPMPKKRFAAAAAAMRAQRPFSAFRHAARFRCHFLQRCLAFRRDAFFILISQPPLSLSHFHFAAAEISGRCRRR